MKKEYNAPQVDTVIIPCQAVMLYVSEGEPNNNPADAPTRKFAPSYDHNNMV